MVSQHFRFITERISDILELEEEREVEYSDDERIRKLKIKKPFNDLHKMLSRVVVYLIDVEEGRDEQQHDHNRLYLDLCDIADCSDEILNDTYDGNYTANEINDLVERIRKFNSTLPSRHTYILNTGRNNNLGGQQTTTINIDTSHSRAPIINRTSRPKTYAEYSHSDFVGFQQEIQSLLHHLTQDNETCVVGIVGMGGSGKTTLAKHVYHHSSITTHFTHKVWVCISESWDQTSILKEICSQVVPEAKDKDYGEVIHLLSEHLKSRSYLLVLDDMWSIDAWLHISLAFPPCSCGSKVVVTSRNIAVPQQFNGVHHIVEPKPLDDEQSLELFKKKDWQHEDISGMQLEMGEEMVKKCKGLPLAIVALAGVLWRDKRHCNWERVSKTLTHNILKVTHQSTHGFVKEVLALSYRELPHHLKQCVLYLRLFPEDYVINARDLMKIWIAEGLISTNEEYTAEEYLDEIVQRHIVKVVKTNFMGQVSRIRIHDLFRQMFVDINKERGLLRDSLRLALNTSIYGDVQNCNFSNMSQSVSIANVERMSWSERIANLERYCDVQNRSRMVVSEYFANMERISQSEGFVNALRYIAEENRSRMSERIANREIYCDEQNRNFSGMSQSERIANVERYCDEQNRSRMSWSEPIANRERYCDEQNCNFSGMSQSEYIKNVKRVFLSESSSHIRSLIFFNHLGLFESALQSMFVNFRLLRVLILNDIGIIPEEIGNLIHLRYFELTGFVEQFPGFIGNLRNLQTLNIRKLDWPKEAKMNLCKLKELRHLYLSNNFREVMDMEKLKLEKLEKLKTLSNVAGGEWMLLGMTRMSVVLEELHVQWISSEEQIEVVFRTPSITSNNLQTLELDWTTSGLNKVTLGDMTILKECKSLKKLKLVGEIQANTKIKFPPNLIKLVMGNTRMEKENVMKKISKSCRNLEILKLGSKSIVGKELVCNANSFPKLMKLTLKDLGTLALWIIESNAMPSLHNLTISNCKCLDLYPKGRARILQVPQLTIQDCWYLKQPPRALQADDPVASLNTCEYVESRKEMD